MGQAGEVWQEFNTDPVALSSAQLNFPECVALLIQVRELQGSACHHHSVSLGSAKSGTEEGKGAAALKQCHNSTQQCFFSPGEQSGHTLSSPPWLSLSQLLLSLTGVFGPLGTCLVLANYSHFAQHQDFTDCPVKMSRSFY